MIVEERVDNFVNIYVSGMVFTADESQREWAFGDGDNSDVRWQSVAAGKGMSVETFKNRYSALCSVAAGWVTDGWTYRYEVVTLDGFGSGILQEVMDTITEAITRNKVAQDRKKCNEMLRRYASMTMIRMHGLALRKYIYEGDNPKGTIVYQMEELSPGHIEYLIPEKVRKSVLHKSAENSL